MSKLLALFEMLVCLAGINICFGLWSVKQERIVKFPYDLTQPLTPTNSTASAPASGSSDYFTTTFLIGLSQTVAGLVVGLLTLVLHKLFQSCRGGGGRKEEAEDHARAVATRDAVPPLCAKDVRQILSMGFTNAFGTSLGYAAMRRLPYPVALAAKMSKMVPVMIVGFLWYGTRYPMNKVSSCALLTLGVMSFYLLKDDTVHSSTSATASTSTTPESDRASGLIGFVLILANLIMDGFTNSTQDELVRRRRWGSAQLMVCANGASTLWLLAISAALEKLETPVTALVYGLYPVLHLDSYPGMPAPAALLSDLFAFRDLSSSLNFLNTHRAALTDLGLMSLMNALGQVFIFRTIASFGGLAMTGMTLVRKAGSIILSIFIHGHVLNTYQWIALAAILAGVIWDGWLNISSRSRAARPKAHSQARGSPKVQPSHHTAAAPRKGKDKTKSKKGQTGAQPQAPPGKSHQSKQKAASHNAAPASRRPQKQKQN